MKEIRCPHCGKVFSVDESEYADLLEQVRNDSFNEELNRRINEMSRTKEAERQAALAELSRTNDIEKAQKDAQIANLQQKLADLNETIANQVEVAVTRKEQELAQVYAGKEEGLKNKITELTNTISTSDAEKKMAVMEAEKKAGDELRQAKEKANEALREKEEEINRLTNEAQKTKELHQQELNLKDEMIAQYKDFKAKQSTKMIGESLEVYCNNQYEQMVRPYLPTAVFGKDNEVVEGTKGDFVFRDMIDGVESVSIMFEMKNESHEAQVKHKNSDFFCKLDSDRKKKNCEYAVLVSLLEIDNDLYNNGIYPVPNYEKMYVVRPQQFLTIISLLVQMGRNTIKVKQELEDAKNRDIDVTNFEMKLDAFKSKFSGHVKDAASRYERAISDIDKAIENMEKMKDDLRLWVEHLYKAENNFEDISIRKLTFKNPTMKAKLDEAREQNKLLESNE